MKWAKENQTVNKRKKTVLALVCLSLLFIFMSGCESEDDCLNCVPLPPPVVPTGVHSISGDDLVIVQWYDISYAPYDGSYNENVVQYNIYSRFYEEGDDNDPNRKFYYIGYVRWDENFDGYSGLHWFYDVDVENGYQYEYAVTAVNAADIESVLSYEFVVDAPLPMSPFFNGNYISVNLEDGNGTPDQVAKSGFNFAMAAENQNNTTAGRVDPTSTAADVVVSFENGFPYVTANPSRAFIQDFGVFTDTESGDLIFEGVSWAPADGYSQTGKIELVPGHIYVVEIRDTQLHYAKLGVTGISGDSVSIIWAYQLIPGLPELEAPEDTELGPTGPRVVSF